jgi:hypothetical protein
MHLAAHDSEERRLLRAEMQPRVHHVVASQMGGDEAS